MRVGFASLLPLVVACGTNIPDRLQDAAGVDAPIVQRPLDPQESLFASSFKPVSSSDALTPGSAAYHCLAAAGALDRARQGAAFDPEFVASLRTALSVSVDYLLSVEPTWGGTGWGYSTGAGAAIVATPFDAFSDGTIDPASTVYAFDDGLAIWCLAEASNATGNAAYYTSADTALQTYLATGLATFGSPSAAAIDCAGCDYFWYSLDQNDVARYLKNTNVEMGMAALAVANYGADTSAKLPGIAAVHAQYVEIHDYVNYSYYAHMDPQFTATEASKLDDYHNGFEAYVLLHAGQILGDNDTIDAAHTHYTAFASAQSSAPTGSVALEAVGYASCHFARIDAAADATCDSWIAAHGANSPAGIGLVLDY